MKDFAKELGCLGFTMRLKRLSDALIQDGKRMYKELGIDIEPNWYVVFRLLKLYEELSVTEIADRIGLAHPSVITLTNKMVKAGYLTSTQCDEDNRRRLLTLTTKAKEKLPQLEQIWDAGEQGVIDALRDTNAMHVLELIESRFTHKGFKERTLNNLSAKQTTLPTVEICDFRDDWASHFASLNYEWLETYFEIEAHDREMLEDPRGYILGKGGKIFFARIEGDVVGTAALIVDDDLTFELAKMAVSPSHQGQAIGRKLINNCISYARKAGKEALVLESNTKLPAAINLYMTSGFRVVPLNECSPYARCNIRMKLRL